MARPLPETLQWNPQRTRRTTRLLALAAAVSLALLVGLFVCDVVRWQLRDQSQQIANYRYDLGLIAELLRDQETAQRGFLLTGAESFLEPYRQAEMELPAVIQRLQTEAVIIGVDGPRLSNDFVAAAQSWQTAADASLDLRRQAPLAPAQEATTLATGKTLFDAVRVRQDAAAQYAVAEALVLVRRFNAVRTTTLALLTLVSLAMLGTVGYSASLVQRIGEIANLLQVRQDRVQAYNRVVTAMNGPTEIQALLQGVLPLMLETVGGQVGVVYVLEQGGLRPAATLGISADEVKMLRPGEGIPGTAVQQNRQLVLNDVPSDTPWRINTGVGVFTPRSLVCLPLRFGNETQGALLVASATLTGDDEVQQLRLAATQLATAISNVRAFEDVARQREELRVSNGEIARRLEESETLQEMGRELAQQRDVQEVLDLVCYEARRLLHADYAAVMTRINRDGATRCMAVEGVHGADFRTTVFPPRQGLAARVIEQGAPVVLNAEELHTEDGELAVYLTEGTQAVIGVPLWSGAVAVGALLVGFRQAQIVTEETLDLSAALAAYASVAMENARLLSELSAERDMVQARARELESKNREVERANRLKSEFVANMSHELRTPLNSILALSQILDDELDGELNGEQHKQITIIERNGQNLLRLINDILDLSKIESGKLELLPTAFSVVALLEQVQTTVLPLLGAKPVRFAWEGAPDVPEMYTDENKLKQILLNLLSNAVKFTERGVISVHARNGREVGGKARPGDGWVSFEVADTGIGIAADDLPTIWEEFQQVDGSLSRRYEGTGLGLAIVRRLVQLMGGDIAVESVVGRGSTFCFSVPVHLPAAAPQRSEEATPVVEAPRWRLPAGNKPLVLVVDDEPEVLYILEKYLRDEGYDIAVAHTGDEAIAKARELHPFAITLDVMLPGRDGWEVIQTLKSDESTADIPIIVLSMLDNRQLGYSLGASDYLVKPVSRNDLLERLERIKNGHPLVSVLVVDDDPIEQRVLATTFHDIGMEVTSCLDGPSALLWLETHQPDLITLDLMMPGMDGFSVLEVIKAQSKLQTIPILIITAKEITAQDRARLNNATASVIQKGPRQRDEVLHEVRGLLERQLRRNVKEGVRV